MPPILAPTPDIWSPAADPIIRTKRPIKAPGVRNGLPLRKRVPTVIIIHTTGSGIIIKALKRGLDPREYAAAYYAGLRAFSSGYLVGWDKHVVGTVPEQLVAYHTGSSRERAAAYRRGYDYWSRYTWVHGSGLVRLKRGDKRYEGWKRRWPDLESPLELPTGRYPNFVSVGVDLLAPPPGEPHPQAQLAMAAGLVLDIADRWEIELSKTTLLRHVDCDPATRSNKRGGWDPPMGAFRDLCARVGVAA